MEEGWSAIGLREAEITTGAPQNFRYMIMEIPSELLGWIWGCLMATNMVVMEEGWLAMSMRV